MVLCLRWDVGEMVTWRREKKKNEGERKEMEVAAGLVAGGEVLHRGGIEASNAGR